jgi:hypothetical protein
MSIKRFVLIAVLFCGFGAGELRAQAQIVFPTWRLVAGGLPGIFTAVYFFDPLHGVTAANNGANLYYTIPNKWLQSSMPTGVSLIRQFRFIQGKLYAASQGTDILVSTDSGRSWQFSGLNLNNANDVYADGSGNIRILTDPMTRFARIDTLDCVATGNGSIFRSSDGGLNWTSVVTGIDPASTGAFGDPCLHVFVCPSPVDDAIIRSTDSGQTWKSVYTGSYRYPESIDGASTVLYLSDLFNLYRSIDDGNTWTPVYTVDSGPLTMYVWGPMGDHVAVGWLGPPFSGIWMTTTGGDENLHSGVNLSDSNGAPLLQFDTFRVPLRLTSTCNPFLIAIPFEADVRGMSEKVSFTANNPGDFAIIGPDTISLRIGAYDSLWLAYNPHHSIDTVLFTFENHWNCSDWTETRTVIVLSYPQALIATPPPLTGHCNPATEGIFVKLDSCEFMVVDSLNIPPEISSRLRFTGSLPDTLRVGVNDSLFFTFDPSDTVANILDSVQVFAHYLGTNLSSDLNYWNFNAYLSGDSNFAFFQQLVPVNLIALSNSNPLATATPSVDAGLTSICQSRDTFVVIQNLGCLPINITGATVSSPDFVITGGGGDTTLAPNAYDTIHLQTNTDTAGGKLTNNATLTVSSNAPTPLAPISLSSEILYPVVWNLHLSHPDSAMPGADVTFKIIQSGKLPPSVTALDLTITYDDDLLRFVRAEEPSVDTIGYNRTADGLAHLTFHVTPVGSDSIIATLHFYPYVASMTQTAITLANPNLSSTFGGSGDCIASISTGQTVFTLIPICGSPQLSSFLLTGTVTIDNIEPNPATGSIVVSVASGFPATASAELSIIDALGRTLCSNNVALVGGEENHFPLNIDNLPSGIYAIHLRGAGVTSTREFVKE